MLYVKAADCKGQRALHFAVAHNYEDVVQLLLEQPMIDVSSRDDDGRTAAQNNNHMTMSVFRLPLRLPGFCWSILALM